MEKISIIRSGRRTIKWNILFHYSNIFYALVSGIVLVPLYLSFISLEVYGAWLAVSSIVGWIAIADPGLATAVMQKTSEAYGEQDQKKLNGLITNGVLLSGVIALVIMIIGIMLSPYILKLLNIPNALQFVQLIEAYKIAVIGMSFLVFSYGITAFNQGLQSSLGIGLVFVVVNLTSLIFTTILFYNGQGLMALPLGMVFRGLGLTLGNLVYLVWRNHVDKMQIRFSLYGLQDLTKLMSFTFLGRGVGTIAGNMDTVIITRFLGPEMTAVYVFTRKAAEIGVTFLERPAMAFMPSIASLKGNGDLQRVREILLRLFRLIIWFLGLILVGLVLMNKAFVSLWVGGGYYAGFIVNGLIAVNVIIVVLASALSNLCYALGNIKGNSIAILIQGLLSICLMIFGVDYIGIVGIIVAPMLATLIVAGSYYPRVFVSLLYLDKNNIFVFVDELYPSFLASTVTFCSLFWWVNSDGWISFVLFSSFISVIYVVLLYATSLAFRTEFGIVIRRLFSH